MDLEEPGPEASATQWCREAETEERERKTEQPFGFSIFDLFGNALPLLCFGSVFFCCAGGSVFSGLSFLGQNVAQEVGW